MNKNLDTTQCIHSLNEWERHKELLSARKALIASRYKALNEEWKLESAITPEGVNIDKLKSLNIQYRGLIKETKELSMEMEIHTEKAKELTGEDLEGKEGKEAEANSGVSGRISIPLNITTNSQLAAQKKEPESRADDCHAQSDIAAQLPSANTPLPITTSAAQEELISQEEEWLCHLDILRSRASLQSSRSAEFFEEMERERIFRPEGVDEKLSNWISRMDEQMMERRELKLEMDAHEEKYWELDGVVMEKVSRTGNNLDGKRAKGAESGLKALGEFSIPSTRKLEVSAQSLAPSPTPPLNITTLAKDQPIFCLREWDIQFDIFRSRAAHLTSRAHGLDQEINLIQPQTQAINQQRSCISHMEEIMREMNALKAEIIFHAQKVRERLRGLDVEASWTRGYEEGLSRRVDGLKGMLNIFGEENLQLLEEEGEIYARPQEDPDLMPAFGPLDIALAETESSIAALLSTYKKTEISSLNSTLTNAQTSPAPSEANPSKNPAALYTVADDIKRAIADYLQIMKEEEDLRAMRERSGMLGGITRDCYENALIAKERGSIAAAGDNKISAAEEAGTMTTPAGAGAETLTAEDHDDDVGRGAGSKLKSKQSSTTTTARETPQQKQQCALLWPWVVPLVYVFLILLLRSLFWIFSSLHLMATTERETIPPPGPRVNTRRVNPCETGQDSKYR